MALPCPKALDDATLSRSRLFSTRVSSLKTACTPPPQALIEPSVVPTLWMMRFFAILAPAVWKREIPPPAPFATVLAVLASMMLEMMVMPSA